MQTEIDVFRCPSDVGVNPNQNRPFTQPSLGATVYLGISNYPACGGSETERSGVFPMPEENTTTQLWRVHTCKFAQITDGTSNTIFIGERGTTPIKQGDPGAWAAVWAGMSAEANVVRWRAIRGLGWYRLTDGDSLTGGPPTAKEPNESFSSLHPGGAQFLMGDDQVRFISQNIDWKPINIDPPGTFNRLCDKDDNLPVGNF
jgi:hypothetical protein